MCFTYFCGPGRENVREWRGFNLLENHALRYGPKGPHEHKDFWHPPYIGPLNQNVTALY